MKKHIEQAAQHRNETIQARDMRRSAKAKLAGVVLALVAMASGTAVAENNSRSAQAVLRIQVTVMPVLLPAQQQANAVAASAVTFNLQGEQRAAGQVAQAPMPERLATGEGQVLETTTVVAD